MVSKPTGNPPGRPPKWKTPQEMQKTIDEYFAKMDEPKLVGDTIYYEPVTITGLCLALGTTRDILCSYEAKPEFSSTIKLAKMKVEHYAERMLHVGRNQSGAIFALKNFGWRDKVEQELTGKDGGAVSVEHKLSPTDVEILNAWKERQ